MTYLNPRGKEKDYPLLLKDERIYLRVQNVKWRRLDSDLETTYFGVSKIYENYTICIHINILYKLNLLLSWGAPGYLPGRTSAPGRTV